MHRRALVHATSAIACLAAVIYGCSSDDDTPAPPGNDGGPDVADSGPIQPGKDSGPGVDSSGCATAPALGSNPESKCTGKLGQKTPDGTGKEPSEPCTDLADCVPFCCACPDGGFISSVAICRCGKCGTSAETCETFQKSNFCTQ